MPYALSSADLVAGRNLVQVGEKQGKVTGFVSIDGDPVGGIRVLFDNGISNCYANSDADVKLVGKALTAVTPWEHIANPGEAEQWLSLYVAPGGLAARVQGDGLFNVYSGRGDWAEGRGTGDDVVASAKAQAIECLDKYGCDTSVLKE